MANQSSETNPPSNLQTYGVPIYAADWIPDVAVRSKIAMDQENSEDGESSSSVSSSRSYIVLTGGGGEGRSGIPNVNVVKGEAERHRLQREELEMELHPICQQMESARNADREMKSHSWIVIKYRR